MKEPYLAVRRRIARALLVRRFDREPINDGDIVFLGDSITAQGQWAAWFPHHPIVVRAIGGDTSKGVLGRVDQVVRATPSKLFLMVGTNDVSHGVPMEQTLETVGMIVRTIRGRAPETQLYVQSVTPRTAAFAPTIVSLNDGLQRLAVASGATYVDLFTLMADDRGALRPGFSNDDVHLQPPAYDVWRAAAGPLVTA